MNGVMIAAPVLIQRAGRAPKFAHRDDANRGSIAPETVHQPGEAAIQSRAHRPEIFVEIPVMIPASEIDPDGLGRSEPLLRVPAGLDEGVPAGAKGEVAGGMSVERETVIRARRAEAANELDFVQAIGHARHQAARELMNRIHPVRRPGSRLKIEQIGMAGASSHGNEKESFCWSGESRPQKRHPATDECAAPHKLQCSVPLRERNGG